jgi:hypothetical protein
MYTPLKLIALLLTSALLLPTSAGAQTPTRFASVYKITGSVVAIDSGGSKKRTLKAGDPVYVGEQIHADASGEAVLRTEDAGVIAVRPNATFVMDQFSANGDNQDKFSIRILTGALRMITGWTGLFNKDNHRIVTPSATLGIRGTDHEPYVMSAELSVELQQPEGTYNRVYKGGTVLQSNGGEVDINPGQVGFAAAPPPGHTRALMTVLLPALLDKVPGFFVPGAFDTELEALAQESMREATRTHKVQLPTNPAAANGSAATPATPGANPETKAAESGACQPTAIATNWLTELDSAIDKRDATQFLSKFDNKARITATVRNAQGAPTEVSFTREEMVKSTFDALSQLSEFSSRRPVITAKLSPATRAVKCDHLEVESVVIESGKRNGGSYRVESVESYRLVKLPSGWIAVQANTRQR